MRSLIACLIALTSLNSFGNYRWDLERNLKTLSRQINVLSHENADLLTIQELRDSIRKLKQVKRTLLGINRDYPTPVCAQENPQIFKQTFKSIKIFAYSIKGPELPQEEAINYAVDWTNSYPCNYADYFMSSYLTVKRYANVENGGLDLPLPEAIAYANEKTPLFCGNQNFKQDFFAIYKLAKYEMELPDGEAREYAKRVVERDHFNCRWDDRIIENNVNLFNAPILNSSNVCITPIIVAPIPGVNVQPNMTPNIPRK